MEAHRRCMPFLGMVLMTMVEGLAERYMVTDDMSFLMTKGRQGRAQTAAGERLRFQDYVQDFGRAYSPGSPEYESRQALFEERLRKVEEHNAQPGRLWEAAVNHLTDRTEEELRQLRGYRRDIRPDSGRGPGLVGTSAVEFDLSRLPAQFTWKGVLRATTNIQDQAQCGSCWAFSSATVLRAHSELFQKDHHFSAQQIVSCTPNPKECGGRGGCTGATAELAMDYVARAGCLAERDFPYKAAEVKCPSTMQLPTPMDISTISGPSLHQMVGGGGSAASLGLRGFQKLPENQLEPALSALVSEGPLAVSIAAGSGWNMYSRGIYNSCPKEVVIDHAVMLVGWGGSGAKGYWQIQNSWGPAWGEGGYIRMIRRDHQRERRHCGWDRNPSIGSGCKGGPSSVWVCGSCGILYDVVMPTFNVADGSWWAKHGRNVTPSQGI
mmetsp:Transcript_35378/g.110304  ORF Transcript_35378/g.110304 Transcript_35378/m.110304 type:complete len:437 (+) Transcript_35378:68-1378(+)